MRLLLSTVFILMLGCSAPQITESYATKPQSEIEQLLSPQRSQMLRDWARAFQFMPSFEFNEQPVLPKFNDEPVLPKFNEDGVTHGSWIIIWD